MSSGNWLLLVLALSGFVTLCQSKDNKILVIFIDGFRWDYFDRFNKNDLPGFNTFWDKGVKADYLQPVYPSRTLMNAYSFLTGKIL